MKTVVFLDLILFILKYNPNTIYYVKQKWKYIMIVLTIKVKNVKVI